MKKLFLIFTCTSIFQFAMSQSDCSVNDCLSSPISSDCIEYCQSITAILNSASESELKLIGGFEGKVVIKIMDERKSTEILNPKEFEIALNNQEKESFYGSLAFLNDERINYFNLSENKTKQFKKKLDKIMIEIEQP